MISRVVGRPLLAMVVLLLVSFSALAQDESVQALPLVSKLSGVYRGNLPCEECRIIETELQLDYTNDTTGTYVLMDRYMGKDKKEVISSSRRQGSWMVAKGLEGKKGTAFIMLDFDDPDKTNYFLVNPDGTIIPLDKDKAKIESTIDCTMKRVKIEVTEQQ